MFELTGVQSVINALNATLKSWRINILCRQSLSKGEVFDWIRAVIPNQKLVVTSPNVDQV